MRRQAFTLVEMMIVAGIVGLVGVLAAQGLQSSLNWSALGVAQDEVATDITRIWKVMNSDLSQSAWWTPSAPDAEPNLLDTDPVADRSSFYMPMVIQSNQQISSTGMDKWLPTAGAFKALDAYRRTNSSSEKIYNGSGTWELDRLWRDLPGATSSSANDRSRLTGSTFSATASSDEYRRSYFARSQELLFVRSTGSLWDQSSQRPIKMNGIGYDRIQPPTDSFKASHAIEFPVKTDVQVWRTSTGALSDADNIKAHRQAGVLMAAAWYSDAGTWKQYDSSAWGLPATAPYGRVLEAARIYNVESFRTGAELQLEEYGNPDYGQAALKQRVDDLRVYGYLVVPCPGGGGLGRLVRTRTERGITPPPYGVKVGERISSDSSGTCHVVVDRVLSDNVVRVLFETRRHVDDIGINNIRVTIFFAKNTRPGMNDAPVVHQSVTMVFTMSATNANLSQKKWRDSIALLPIN